jgi:hypothetical protein
MLQLVDPIAWAIGATTTEFIVNTSDPLTGCNTYDTTYITGRVVDTSIVLNGKKDFCTVDPAWGILSVSNAVTAVQWYDGANPVAGATGFNFKPLVSGNYWAQIQAIWLHGFYVHGCFQYTCDAVSFIYSKQRHRLCHQQFFCFYQWIQCQ